MCIQIHSNSFSFILWPMIEGYIVTCVDFKCPIYYIFPSYSYIIAMLKSGILQFNCVFLSRGGVPVWKSLDWVGWSTCQLLCCCKKHWEDDVSPSQRTCKTTFELTCIYKTCTFNSPFLNCVCVILESESGNWRADRQSSRNDGCVSGVQRSVWEVQNHEV